MIDFLTLKIKKSLQIFIIPFLIEIGFIVSSCIWKKDTNISAYHAIWMLAAMAILFAWIVGQIIYEYYLDGDQLINILPFNKQVIVTTTTIIYAIFFTIFGILCQYGQYLANYRKKVSIGNVAIYGLDKIISILAGLFLLILIITIFKNIRKPSLGILVILIVTVILIVLQVKIEWSLNKLPSKNFIIGVTNGADCHFVNLNIISVGFTNISDKLISKLRIVTDIVNLGVMFGSVIMNFIISKIKKLNYVDLIH